MKRSDIEKIKRNEIVHLDISSFVGMSPGAEHCYGEIIFTGLENEDIKLTRALTQREAGALNKKDGVKYSRYRKGDETNRFDTENALVEFAIKLIKKEHPDIKVIVKGSSCTAQPQEVVYGPKVYMHFSNVDYEDVEACYGRFDVKPEFEDRYEAALKRWNGYFAVKGEE